MGLAPAVLAWEPAACSTKVDQTMPQRADRALDFDIGQLALWKHRAAEAQSAALMVCD